jgi:Insertion element 4 transposase N-terminal/Transposase DDE domain
MGFRLREFNGESKFCRELRMDAIRQVVSMDEVKYVLSSEGVVEQRERKLNMVVTVFIVIGMGLFESLSIGNVYKRLTKGLRYIWPEPEYAVAKDSAISYRRSQLGARPLVALFRRLCRPLASEATPGAFLHGLRLMAIDGTSEEVADTPENAAVFGRHQAGRGESAYPQMRCVYLAECGTHAIVDAGFWPLETGERTGGFRMLRSLTAGMLVMWDRGFHDYDMLVRVRQQAAHALGRLPAHVKPKPICTLPDGSYLAYLYPADPKRRRRGEHLLVRIITYTLKDSALPGYGETYRLLTTLLNSQAHPALELACAYHERWEIELVIDEIDTHQRIAQRPLRSKKPVAVIQEAYGLLIAHFIIRFLMHQAAALLGIDPDHLSFTHALEVVRLAIDEFQMTTSEQLDRLYRRLLNDIAAGRLPKRRFRFNPRVVKRKMSKFLKKRPEHDHPLQPRLSWRDALVLI